MLAIAYGDSMVDDSSERPISALKNLHRFLDRELRFYGDGGSYSAIFAIQLG